ncbi:MAG: RIP metalloprotease [Actinomycetes bacterium]
MTDQQRSLIKLITGLVLVVAVFLFAGLGSLLLVIVALLLMVMLHELGHFATAKWTGMQVTQFFVGFGPRLWSINRGETEYGIKAIPAGGYCRITGMTMLEEVEDLPEERTYRAKSYPRRLLVASAGSAMHFVMAFAIAFFALWLLGLPSPAVVEISAISAFDGGQASPAAQAGLKPGDRIVAINGQEITSPTSLTDVIHDSVAKPVTLSVDRQGEMLKIVAVPVDGRSVSSHGHRLAPIAGPAKGFIGVGLQEGSERLGIVAAFTHSGSVVASATRAAVQGMLDLFSPSGVAHYAKQVSNPGQDPQASRPESIVGAVRTATQASDAGSLALAEVLISLNIFIGLFNLLPMLPLDGGHIAIASYERIRSRKGKPYHADVAKLMPVVWIFLSFLALLVFSSLYLDLTHPVANPFP